MYLLYQQASKDTCVVLLCIYAKFIKYALYSTNMQCLFYVQGQCSISKRSIFQVHTASTFLFTILCSACK